MSLKTAEPGFSGQSTGKTNPAGSIENSFFRLQ
jgi:hypothetical protein